VIGSTALAAEDLAMVTLQSRSALFAVEGPRASRVARVGSPFVVSGWIIPHEGKEIEAISIFINSEVRTQATTGLKRLDVRKAFPEMRNSLRSGFAAEVFADDLLNQRVTISLTACYGEEEEEFLAFEVYIARKERVTRHRTKAWSLEAILACPNCLGELNDRGDFFSCEACGRRFNKRRGTPLFVPDGKVAQSKLLETNPTHPNHEEHNRIIRNAANGIVLDFGAGNPAEPDHNPNVVFHEFVQYAQTDVVSLYDTLPYRENTFDAIISKAVFEHIPRPWDTALELYRILKPGGIIQVDTAFMQPFHGDPHHYFNMTLKGVREIFKPFKHLRSGIKPYQMPSFGFKMQIETLLEHLESEEWRRRFADLQAAIPSLDIALDDGGKLKLAAGFFFEGTKVA
jgi:SAM-dependent methyltransferase